MGVSRPEGISHPELVDEGGAWPITLSRRCRWRFGGSSTLSWGLGR